MVAGAQDQVNGLSEMSIVAGSGFALLVGSRLLLAGVSPGDPHPATACKWVAGSKCGDRRRCRE
jgi:hypothetical protein